MSVSNLGSLERTINNEANSLACHSNLHAFLKDLNVDYGIYIVKVYKKYITLNLNLKLCSFRIILSYTKTNGIKLTLSNCYINLTGLTIKEEYYFDELLEKEEKIYLGTEKAKKFLEKINNLNIIIELQKKEKLMEIEKRKNNINRNFE